MKFRSSVELQDFLDANLSLRKQELITLRFSVLSCRREHEERVLLRAAIPLLYSHWEGFIKSSATAYLKFVSQQGILLKDLHHNFVALACRAEILAAAPTKKVGIHMDIINFMVNNFNHAVPLNVEGAVDTESNLTSKVLKDIIQTVGFAYTPSWETKSLWIDQQLIKYRNEIAHGELSRVDVNTYDQLHTHVIDTLDEFKTEIENAVVAKLYLK